MTSLVQAEVDGERLSEEEIAAFFVLLSVAGNDTTRNTISRTMEALTRFPDQRKILQADPDGTLNTAVDEFVRWASPVMTFRRVATRDVELHGQRIRAGDWVVMFYASGNRDERVFTEPYTFDVTRSPNPHVGFGGGGPHFCMGNMLARTSCARCSGSCCAGCPTCVPVSPSSSSATSWTASSRCRARSTREGGTTRARGGRLRQVHRAGSLRVPGPPTSSRSPTTVR